uniref:Uncharacterized protein n=1 Tax=Leptocylindrus danicus TaxID=163516 RepID=A0A7S2KQ24_9STRA
MTKQKRAKDYLNEIVGIYRSGDKDLKPNTFLFNAVLGACISTRGSDKVASEAFEIALDTYNEMREREFTRPDAYTYGSLLKACDSLLPRNDPNGIRDDHGITLFRACCEDGLLTANVLSFLMKCVSKQAFLGIHERAKMNGASKCNAEDIMEQLPQEWSRNAPKQINKDKRRTLSKMRSSGRRLRKEGGVFR